MKGGCPGAASPAQLSPAGFSRSSVSSAGRSSGLKNSRPGLRLRNGEGRARTKKLRPFPCEGGTTPRLAFPERPGALKAARGLPGKAPGTRGWPVAGRGARGRMARERRRRAGPEGGRAQERVPRGAGGRRERTGAGAGPALLALPAAVLLLLALGWGLYARWGPAARLVAPHAAPRALPPGSTGPDAAPVRFWGSYRPQVYFGMKTRSPRSPVAGLMWLQQLEGDVRLRHTCEQSDGLPRYGWLLHDGAHVGVQEIQDLGFSLQTEVVKRPGGEHGGDWSWRVTVRPERTGPKPPFISLFFYVATDGQGTLQPVIEEKSRLALLRGWTEELGNFTVTFQPPTTEAGTPLYAKYNHLQAMAEGLHHLTDVVKSSLNPRFSYAPPGLPKRHYFGVDVYHGRAGDRELRSQLLVHQVTVAMPCRVEVAFESGSMPDRPDRLLADTLTRELDKHVANFKQRFEETFGLSRKGFSGQEQHFARALLSNMLGGMGYFYGRSLVQSPHTEAPQLYPAGALFTAVPSRSFFPRGFLWDEGFHQLLLARWDPALSQEVMAHWFDLMNVEGWIPREQILGDEALAKVPPEFVVQHSQAGNPPTFFLVLQQLLRQGAVEQDYLRRIYPRLQSWYGWYNHTQAGALPYTFRWRGRDQDTQLFLNPKTLTSGLDDYPRASHPSEDERHLDLRCWMAVASAVMAEVATRVGEPGSDYAHMAERLADSELLEQHHWSDAMSAFADYGNHTQAVALEREHLRPPPGQPPPIPRLVRVVRKLPRLQFVGGALGYVSLFPLLLQLLPPDSRQLGSLLADMKNEQKLWTPFGLRSLSRSSPFYLKRNTEHDPPYWRGAIWINMNYLAVRALHHYSRVEGPYREEVTRLYHELRTNVVSNVLRQYLDSGYVWEQYNDSTGRGQGCYPFTGWSALVVLMMAEEY